MGRSDLCKSVLEALRDHPHDTTVALIGARVGEQVEHAQVTACLAQLAGSGLVVRANEHWQITLAGRRSLARAPDRRRAPRTRIRLHCGLERPVAGRVEGLTHDIGPGGMRVTCHRSLEPDEVVRFAMHGRGVSGMARVIREEGQNTFGLRFVRLADPVRAALLQITA